MDSHALVLVDPSGVIRHWSQGAEGLFGHVASDVVGQTLDVIIPEPYRQRHWDAFHAAVGRGRMKFEQPAANIPILHDDGTVRRYPGRLVMLRDAHDVVVGLLGIWEPSENPDGDPDLPRI